MWIDKSPFWFKPDAIKKIEELKNAKHMGYWCLKTTCNLWAENPVDIFYVENPDTSKGHTHYFGLFYRDDRLFITSGDTAFSEPITGVLTSDEEVIVSRYRHDFQQRKGIMIDGGRDYIRTSSPVKMVNVTVSGSEFIFQAS